MPVPSLPTRRPATSSRYGNRRAYSVSSPMSHSSPVSDLSHNCRKRKIKLVDEACRLRLGLREGLEWVLCADTLSPHFVSTLCRLRFVPTLCHYALSKAKEGANVPAPRSLQMRLGARGLRGSAETSPGTRPPSTPIEPHQPPSRLVNDSIGTAYCYCLMLLPTATAYSHCLPFPRLCASVPP